MTTIASWISIDNRGPSALYIASDSRITWSGVGTGPTHWDQGRKLFASNTSADIFGYSGDVIFPSMLLSQVLTLLDVGMLFSSSHDTPPKRAERVQAVLEEGMRDYPDSEQRDFLVFYGTRAGERPIPYLANTKQPKVSFHLYQIGWSRAGGWMRAEAGQPSMSEMVASGGSGKSALTLNDLKWKYSYIGGTSRAVFGAFCETLETKSDSQSGGAPQLVCITPAGKARSVGMVWEDALYVFGRRVEQHIEGVSEWRNSLFEVCDPATRRRTLTAQPQPRPRF